MFAGYFERPQETAEALRDDWLWTGDLATMDAEGFVPIAGRRKEMFISGGENVFPVEIENALYDLPGVSECAVLGVPDPRWGEVGLAVVVPRPGGARRRRGARLPHRASRPLQGPQTRPPRRAPPQERRRQDPQERAQEGLRARRGVRREGATDVTDAPAWNATDDLELRSGIRMRVVQTGRPEGEPVVLINGIFMHTGSWEGLEQALAPDYRVVRYDGRGQGESSKPEGPYTVAQHTDDLEALLDALALGPVHLVGLSNGALAALELAGRRPGACARSPCSTASPASTRCCARSCAPGARRWPWAAPAAASTSPPRGCGAMPSSRSTRPRCWASARGGPARRPPRAGAGRGHAGLRRAGARRPGRRAQLPRPAAVPVGDEDLLSPPRYSLEILEAAGRGRLHHAAGGARRAVERPDAAPRAGRLLPDARGARPMSEAAATCTVSTCRDRLAFEHAGAGTPWCWSTATSRAAASGRTVEAPPAGLALFAPDLPGFGASGPLPGPVTIAPTATCWLASWRRSTCAT